MVFQRLTSTATSETLTLLASLVLLAFLNFLALLILPILVTCFPLANACLHVYSLLIHSCTRILSTRILAFRTLGYSLLAHSNTCHDLGSSYAHHHLPSIFDMS
jgi:hypothetical protein